MPKLSVPIRPQLRNGYFFLGDRAFYPVGFNYWPSASGVHCWKNFNPDEWKEDFQEIAQRGYNAIRFFLLWPDFQPEENRVDEQQLKNLREVVTIAARYGLWVIPTIFQGWMSGTNFDPAWRGNRNHVMDASLRVSMERLTREVCGAIADADNLLALDFANEIDAICHHVTGEGVRTWTRTLRAVVAEEIPGLLVTNGTAVNPVRADSAWCFGDQDIDFHCMHGYPMFWNPLPVGSLATVRASTVFAAMTGFAGGYGPVMREEYGTAIGGDGELIGSFVRTSTYASYLAGANGFLYWCWRDFTSRNHPYQKDPFESSMGYVDINLKSKQWSAGLDEFKDFLHAHSGWSPRHDAIGIYIPRQIKSLGPRADEAMASAYENIVAAGFLPRFTARIEESWELLVLPVTELEIGEIGKLRDFCRAGGKVIALGVTAKTCGRHWEELTGTRQDNIYRACEPLLLGEDGEQIEVPAPGRGQSPWPVLRALDPTRATSWLEDSGIDWGWQTAIGDSGCLVQATLPIINSEIEVRPEYVSLWRKMLALAGMEPRFRYDRWELQCAVLENDVGERKLMVINHATQPVATEVAFEGHAYPLVLGAREVLLQRLTGTEQPVTVSAGVKEA
jgi:hypothetical protein